MEKLLELLQILGVYVDDSAPPIVMLSLYFLVSSCFILLNVINICIYLLSIYIVSNERVLSKIPDRSVYVHKLLKFYKNIRISYIIYEVILLLIILIVMISVTYAIVSLYLHVK